MICIAVIFLICYILLNNVSYKGMESLDYISIYSITSIDSLVY